MQVLWPVTILPFLNLSENVPSMNSLGLPNMFFQSWIAWTQVGAVWVMIGIRPWGNWNDYIRSRWWCCSVTKWLCVTQWTEALQASPSFTVSQVCSNSCPLSQWWHPTISSSVTLFLSCPQSFPVSGSFPMSWLFTSGGQSIGTSALVLPVIQGWFPLGLTGLISLLSKGISSIFSNTTIQKWEL